MKYSGKQVGFTSAMKMGFVFGSDSESSNYPNHVYTEFKASEKAVDLIEQLKDSQVMTVEIDNEIVVLSADEAKTLGLPEVTLKVIDKNTAQARWVDALKIEGASMNLQNYVAEYLDGASTQFLQEIVDHGIYNTGADVLRGSSDAEYAAIATEFEQQAQAKLGR